MRFSDLRTSMSSLDAQIKTLLKKAKKYLAEHEFEYCLDEVKDVLQLDKNNYLAYIFSGKAYHSLDELDKAIKSYRKAIEIDRSNILAWKGLNLVYANHNDYRGYFDFLQEYVLILQDQNELLDDIVKGVITYNKKFNKHNSDLNFYASYLQLILPNTPLGQSIGLRIQPYEKTVEDLLKILRPLEDRKIKEAKRTFPLNPTPNQLADMNQKLDLIYSDSQIPQLYKLIIDYSRDDSVRHSYEDFLLVYEYDQLKAMPQDELKVKRLDKFIDDIKGMITIKHPSQNAWNLYFDLVCSNYESLHQLSLEELCWYVSNFEAGTGLTNIIHGFLYSAISPFSTKKVNEFLDDSVESKPSKDTSDLDLSALQDEKTDEKLSTEEIITLLTTGSEAANESLFASKIIITYYIYMKEYLLASEKTREAVRHLANLSRSTMIKLPVYKRFLLLSLATVDTYLDAPKNFNRAMELYNTIEKEDPDNVTVKIGKSTILIEKGDIEAAKELLKDAVSKTNDRDVEVELAWCQIQSDEIGEGRALLQRAYDEYLDSKDVDKKASVLWRLAESYIIDAKHSEHTDEPIKTAYDYLIQSLKYSQSHAKSYASLGFIYKNYFDDEKKLVKCFYKAFELDNSELIAARELVEFYSDQQEWNMCRVLCERVISNDTARRWLTLSKVEDNSWPYRVLGMCHLQLQEDAKSVEYFQNAIRLNNLDVVSWSCLGEAYFSSGRFEASLKVFEHCKLLILSHTHLNSMDLWHITYMLASVNSSLGNYTEAITLIEELLSENADELAIIKLYCQTLSAEANLYISNGFTGRGINSICKMIDLIHKNTGKLELFESQILWKSLSDGLILSLQTQGYLSKLDLDKLNEICSLTVKRNEFLSTLESEALLDRDDKLQLAVYSLIQCSKNAIEVMPSKIARELRGSLYFNLAVSYLHSFLLVSVDTFLLDAVKCFNRATQQQDNEPTFWIGMGIASFLNSDPSLAQHCFIKSLALAPKDPSAWNNLALFYMSNDDLTLSKEVFKKVQSIAPDSNIGWLGNAMIEESMGDKTIAWKYFTHAFVLSNGRSSASQIMYANSVVQKSVGTHQDKRNLSTVQELQVAEMAMETYLKNFPQDVLAVQLFLTLVERIGGFAKGISFCDKLCEILESLYEETEDEKVLVAFARAKATLARFHLGAQNYDLVLENAQFVLDLLEDDSVDGEDLEIVKVVLSARVSIGLALFFQGDFQSSLEQLKLILAHQESQDGDKSTKERLFVLVAQILYANGSEDSLQAAIDELFTFIEQNGSSLLIALTLGAICVVKDMEDILPAVKSDLLHLELSETINDKFQEIPFFIRQINTKLQIDSDKYDQRAAFMFPSDVQVWENFNKSFPLIIGSSSGEVSSSQLSSTLIDTKEFRLIQRGLFLDPSNLEGYRALNGCTGIVDI